MKTLHGFPSSGIKSMDYDGSHFLLGDATTGDVYLLSNSLEKATLSLITQTGEQVSVDNMVAVYDGNAVFSMGGKLNLLLGETTRKEIVKDFSNAISIGNTITIMDLGEEFITDILKTETGSLVISTSSGRILSCGPELINAYLTGQRILYASVKDGVGFSNSASSGVEYALYQRIAEINENKEIIRWQFEKQATICSVENLVGTFTGPIVQVKSDLGFWKQLLWEENKPDNTNIVVSLRNGKTIEDLLASPWINAFSSSIGESSPITRELNDISFTGAFLQVKVDMITNAPWVNPMVSKVTVKYSTKQASYFFTTKFSLTSESGSKPGVLVATMTEPQNTEVSFGISSKESSNWQDYEVVSPDKLFELANPQDVKVGIKFISYDSNIPEVAEFAVTVGSESKRQ